MQYVVAGFIVGFMIAFLEIYVSRRVSFISAFLQAHPVASIGFSMAVSFMLTNVFGVVGLIAMIGAVSGIIISLCYHMIRRSTSEKYGVSETSTRMQEIKTDAAAAKPGATVLLKVLLAPVWIMWKITVSLLKGVGKVATNV